MARRTAVVVVLIVVALGAVWGAFRLAPRWLGAGHEPAASPTPSPAAAAPERKIKATLYYISEDGQSLAATERDVAFAEPVVAQARKIVEAQIAAAPPPLASPVPPGTTLRSVFITDRGDAFIDLSQEAVANHPGGALEEIFTIYALVDALTVNLPAILRVQILVNGREVDTLAGHLDLRRPLQKNLTWLAPPAAAGAAEPQAR